MKMPMGMHASMPILSEHCCPVPAGRLVLFERIGYGVSITVSLAYRQNQLLRAPLYWAWSGFCRDFRAVMGGNHAGQTRRPADRQGGY